MKRRLVKFRKYRHVTQAVYSTPWAITEAKLGVILDVLDRRSAGEKLDERELRAIFGDDLDEADTLYSYQLTPEGVAILPLQGIVAQRMNMFMRISGGTSTEQLAAAFRQAMDDPEAKAICLDVNSPGGSIGGVAELADEIYAARGGKPCYAVANTQMCSSAYWIGSACERVYASPSADVGSIGVYMIHRESSAASDKAGVKRTVIKAGKYKAVGNDAEPLNAESRGRLQAQVDSVYALFTEAVARNRKTSVERVTRGMAEGDVAIGRDAAAEGLVDGVETIDGVVKMLAAKVAPAAGGARTQTQNTQLRLSGGIAVDPRIKAALAAQGLVTNADATDAELAAVLSGWYRLQAKTVPESTEQILADLGAMHRAAPAAGVASSHPTAAGMTEAETAAISRRAAAEERHRASTIRASCRQLGIEAVQTETFVDLGLSADATNTRLVAYLAEHHDPVPRVDFAARDGAFGGRLEAGESFSEKFAAAAHEGLQARCLTIADPRWGQEAMATLSQSGREVAGMRLLEIATESLRAMGVKTRGLAPIRIATLALASDRPDIMANQGGVGTAYYETGNFANLTLNASRKVLMRGYVEAPVTFREWCRIGEPVIDFKPNNIIKFGEHSDLENQPEGDETPDDTGISDDREYFVVETYSRKTSFTRQMILNDDLSALSRLPLKQGIAAARTFNKLVYNILINNPTMADGNKVFDATHHQGNLITGVNPPTLANLNTMQAALRKMHGLNSDSYLNNPMKWLIVPAALEVSANQLLRSQTDPALTNVGVINPFYGVVKPIVEAYLDSNNAVTYYGACDFNMVDTIEVRYLQGEETPFLESWWDVDKDVRYFKVRQTGTALPVDYRGLVQQQGS